MLTINLYFKTVKVNVDRFEPPYSEFIPSALPLWATHFHSESHVDAILVYTIANSS